MSPFTEELSKSPLRDAQKKKNREEYGEAAEYDSYMNPEPGFRAGLSLSLSYIQ